MGANVFSRPQTQRDVARFFSQVEGSAFDSVRRWQTLRNSLTRKRSLVQIQHGPAFSKTCPAVGAKRGATAGVRLQAERLFRRFKIVSMAVAPVSMTGRRWCQ